MATPKLFTGTQTTSSVGDIPEFGATRTAGIAGGLGNIPVMTEGMPLGVGSQPDDGLDYMKMPAEMATFQAPILPEPEEMQAHPNALKTLNALVDMVADYQNGNTPAPMNLLHLPQPDLDKINQVLGEGEVSATIEGSDALDLARVDIQETVFIGVWRVVATKDGTKIYDALEVNAIPALIRQTASQDADSDNHPVPLPEELVNVPSIIHEVQNHSAQWQIGDAPHVVNLTLLPLNEVDISYIDNQLGSGRITLLSRGYGNCRIVNTLTKNTWRLVFYNSQDKVILNSIEITDMPEVACASAEDLADTHERLSDILTWFEAE